MTYETTPKQEQAIREWLQEAIVPLIEQVLVKKLGQAMSFAAKEVVEPKCKPLTDEEIEEIWDRTLSEDVGITALRKIARAIEAAHGIKGEA